MKAGVGNEPSEITLHLKHALLDLSANPHPEIPNPPETPKRASVAIIIRIQPSFHQWPSHAAADDNTLGRISSQDSLQQRISSFFDQAWVQQGDPEILFIRRAARKGDRWTSHVALPGGKRDPEDVSDKEAAVREAKEEVGVDLSEERAIHIGNLPQRVVTTSWGKVPLMVLCPYIFLLTGDVAPSLCLQPTEVASAHWVSLRALLSSNQRTYEYQDVSNRLAKQEVGLKRWLFRVMLGRMLFSAIHLIPSQSQYCSSISDFIPIQEPSILSSKRSVITYIQTLWRKFSMPYPASPSEKPLLLWGLTLGVMADLLELLPPHTALDLWTYPTFTPWDMRFTLYIMSYNFRRRKKHELSMDSPKEVLAVTDSGNGHISPLESYAYPYQKPAEVGIGGLGAGVYYHKIRNCQANRHGSVSVLLDGYYDILQRAVAVVLCGRISAAMLVGILFWLRYRRARLPS